MRIPSGVTDQYIYFVAVDATNLKTRETGLSSFTVYRSRNNGTATAMTTPTVAEVDATNMPGVYTLLCDEDMTIGAGNDTEEMAFHITQASMSPVTRTIELYRPKITAGNTLDVTATGAAGIDWGNIENPTTSVDLSGTDIQLCDTVTTNTDIGAAGASLTSLGGMSAGMKAEVNAEVVDTLTVDTYGEPSSAPAATASLEDKISWVAALARNKITQTATTTTLKNDADSGAISTATVSDDGVTAIRGEWS